MQACLNFDAPPLTQARATGQAAQKLATDRAEREAPGFRERAEAAILTKLAAGPASGEACTDYVQQTIGFRDGRCLGSLYRSMRLRGLIEIVGACDRAKGHGTGGGKVYAIAQTYEAQKAAWLACNPGASAEQVESACQGIAERMGV